MGKITDSLHLQQSLSFAKSPGFSDEFNSLVKKLIIPSKNQQWGSLNLPQFSIINWGGCTKPRRYLLVTNHHFANHVIGLHQPVSFFQVGSVNRLQNLRDRRMNGSGIQ